MDRSKIRVLVLDDDPFMLKLHSLMLANLGFTQVVTHDNGHAALAWMDGLDTAPDLILFDLNMPEMDGVEFVRHLVKRCYGGSLVLVSGENERMLHTTESLVRAYQVAVLGCLRKQVTQEALAALLDRWAPPRQGQLLAEKGVYSADEVRAAIGNGELVNYYQPKVAVATGQVKGMEALVRWQHPVVGMVYPDQFIGVAEEHGLIDELTGVVLRTALTHAKAWRNMGLALRVAVNVSMDNLRSLDFPDIVNGLATAAGVPPRDVVLEVTESRLMKDLRTALDVLTRLRLKRFGLSIDDFGTGHSSLAQLRDFPFDELKIDRGFVHGAYADATQRAIYDASQGLASQLGMEIVAEGVENRDDWNFLHSRGCDLAQGYFIAKPMPAIEVPGWIDTWNTRVLGEIQSVDECQP